ncbi:MAG: cyclic dehypoxanthinyl futalosine synthase [Miltoncostaeaceae bacterium]|jgi:cyclic dehypoxanthinyl futalosine synthase
MSTTLSHHLDIIERIDAGERLDDEGARALMNSRDVLAVAAAARRARDRVTDPDVVTFVIDRNVNYTNFCVTDCDFCAFYRHPRDPGGYVLPKQVIFRKIEETLDLGGTALLLQGGHHPNLRIEWYEDLFTDIKRRYPIHLHALSPSEVLHIAHYSKLTLDETLTRLIAAGLDSIPGGGAEILVDTVRDVIAPRKTTTAEWLGVMREAHLKGIGSSATMMFGTVDSIDDRIEHLRVLRDLQDETGGFVAFACWSYQSGGCSARGDDHLNTTAADYLMMNAVARLYLDNIIHMQSSWVTQGLRIGQLALEAGCDDMGSIMIEENVVRAAGTAFTLDTPRMVEAIEATGRRAVQRDTRYRVVRRF